MLLLTLRELIDAAATPPRHEFRYAFAEPHCLPPMSPLMLSPNVAHAATPRCLASAMPRVSARVFYACRRHVTVQQVDEEISR